MRGGDEAQPGGEFADDIAVVHGIAAVPTILDVVCRTTGMGFAAVARVTESRWIACSVRDNIGFGLEPGGELAVQTTICNEIRQSGTPVLIDHVREDEVFRSHPTPAMYGFQSYISVPIVLPVGRFFGTLCAIDPAPARVNTPETRGMFKLFADLIAFHLDAHDRLRTASASLVDERRTAELREQFIAVLGHDLRNPLASIDAATKLLARTAAAEGRSAGLLTLVQASVTRMAGLIDNLLDFARGRLGAGFVLELSEAPLEPLLRQVVEELRSSHPQRTIEWEAKLDRPVRCDGPRVAQLFSNLLGNALTHGAADAPVRARALVDERVFVLEVANGGEPISPVAMGRLFAPFERGAVKPGQQGLGLGLFISSEIAKAHGGSLMAASSPEETVFTFTLPLHPEP